MNKSSRIQLETGAARGERANLADVIEVVRRRFWVVLLLVLIGGGLSTALALSSRKLYTATGTLLFSDTATPNAASALLGSAAQPSSSAAPALDQATNVQLVTLQTVAARTARVLGIPVDEVSTDVNVDATSTTNVVNVTATTPNRQFSARLANTYTQQFVAFRQLIDSSAILQAEQQAKSLYRKLPPAERTSSTGKTLQAQIRTLSLTAALQSGDAQIVQQAEVPSGPSSPNVKRDVIGGILSGAIVGIVLALLAERFDRRLRTVHELTAILGEPVLGMIPSSKGLATDEPDIRSGDELEAFQLLRANLSSFLKGLDRNVSLLVTSAQPGDGKSTVSYHLAAALAVAGTRVLWIDADLRKPGRFIRPTGLTQLLAGNAAPDDVVFTVPHAPFSVSGDPQPMDVLPTGPLRVDPALFEGDGFPNLLDWALQRYDAVIIDAPPLTLVSDAVAIAQIVSGVVIVARPGRTERMMFRHLVQRLGLIQARVLGLVANGLDRSSGYGYGYGYGYGIDAPQAERAATSGSPSEPGDGGNDEEPDSLAARTSSEGPGSES